ncbi:MAG: sialidase family protein [Armatimonadota bacterium]
MITLTHEHDNKHLLARVSEPFTVLTFDSDRDAGWCQLHPHLERLPGGRLVLTVNMHGDIEGAEHLPYASDDGGQTWWEYPEWPNAGWAFTVLDGQRCLAVSNGGFYDTGEVGVYHWGIRRSNDGGLTWLPIETARVELHLEMDAPFDPLNPPEQELAQRHGWAHLRRFPPDWQAKGRNPQPAGYERDVWERLGRRRIPAWITSLFRVSATELLAFLYLTPHSGEPSITLCMATEDGGRTWQHRATPGPYDSHFATHGYLRHALDGLCEPSCTRLATGELFLVMRLGSFHPLYATCSPDNGHTWAPPADRRPGCYYETWPARPISVYGILPTVLTLPNGTLALCSGRPDATLSFSFDHGYHWPLTCRFLEDNKPEEQSTYNNTMVQVTSNRLLLLYDRGSNSGKIPEYHGPQHIVGHYIDIAVD